MTGLSELLGEARRLSEGIKRYPASMLQREDWCGDFTCSPETCATITDEERAASEVWIAFNKATPALVPALIAALEQALEEIDDLTGYVGR